MTDREAVTDPVPGLRRLKRGGGVDLYWYATRQAVEAGYKPTVMRLHGTSPIRPTPPSSRSAAASSPPRCARG